MEELEKLIEAVKFTYKNTTAIRFISDIHGNIFWKGGRGVNEKTGILFPSGPPMNNLEDKYSVVTINDVIHFVRGTVLSYDNNGAILWTVFSLNNVLNELGVTDCYADICRLVSESKHRVECILFENEEAIARDPRRRNSASIISQNHSCYSLLKQYECLDALFAAIFKREVNNTTLNLATVIEKIADECNIRLKKISCNISVYSKTVAPDSALIKGNRFYLHLTLMAFINRLLACCKFESHIIRLTFDGCRLIITFTFERDMCNYIDQINGDFSLYCAKMYIKRLGGSVGESDNKMYITLPQYIPRAFHSSDSEFDYNKERFKYLTDMFLFDICEEDAGLNRKGRSTKYTRN
jgi:hypothetical protein